ncbi:MAG: S9 family peptidase, partial [Candidatus Delongbacteria bacterium]|nr:S9 family peptidase [Candidatus Delongbacteria bacterium]
MLTNKDGAINNKIMRTTSDETDEKYWKEYISHNKAVSIEAPLLFSENFLIYKERQNGKINVIVLDLRNNKRNYIDFPDPFYFIYNISKDDSDNKKIKIAYSSYITPYTEYEYDLEQKELKITFQSEIKGFDQSLYSAEKVWATTDNGVKVPISLCYRKDLIKKDGNNPLFLDGYGAGGDTNPEYFDAFRLSLLDRGGIFAVAHIRGSGYLGVKWHEEGKLMNKTNSFTDFIACAEFLIKDKFTSSNKIAAFGRSYGGYLVGSVLSKRPDLFRFAFLQVPGVNFLDDLLDKDPFFTSCIVDEIGNSEIKEEFEVLLKNCPFHNIQKGSYPFIHVLAGLTDTRNNYWGPMKWVAKIR